MHHPGAESPFDKWDYALQGPQPEKVVPLHGQREPIDALEVFDHIRDITDPEHPYSLEQLNVVEEHMVDVDDAAGSVR